MLWSQDMTSGGRRMVDKMRRAENVADVGRKLLSGPVFVKLRLTLGLALAPTAASYEEPSCGAGSCVAVGMKKEISDWTWLW